LCSEIDQVRFQPGRRLARAGKVSKKFFSDFQADSPKGFRQIFFSVFEKFLELCQPWGEFCAHIWRDFPAKPLGLSASLFPVLAETCQGWQSSKKIFSDFRADPPKGFRQIFFFRFQKFF